MIKDIKQFRKDMKKIFPDQNPNNLLDKSFLYHFKKYRIDIILFYKKYLKEHPSFKKNKMSLEEVIIRDFGETFWKRIEEYFTAIP